MASQKHWEDDLQVTDSEGSISIDNEEEVLTKIECEFIFRDEVRQWLDEHGKDLFGNGLPIPSLVKSNAVNTPYKPPFKRQKADITDVKPFTKKSNKTL